MRAAGVNDQESENPRAYPDRPFVGVGVVIFRGDEVLLAQRGKRPLQNSWSIPGGAQELGETVEEAAIREIQEETGLEVDILGLIDVIDSISHDSDGKVLFHYTLVDLMAEWKAGEAAAADDVAAVRWVKIDDIAQYQLRQVTHDVILLANRKRGDQR
jgi:mutator protein MutT